MRRGLAILIVLSLGSLQVQTLAFHVHAASEHLEDRAHVHGPAIHHHDDVDEGVHVDEAETSARGPVITIAVPAATSQSDLVACVVLTEPPRVPELQLIDDARTIDVRSHSPPQASTASLRGPPTFLQS